jgi:hypothetical protein
MKRLACLMPFVLLLPLVGACDLMKLVQGDAGIVQLVNEGAYPVDVELRISGNQYELQVVLAEFGDELNYTVAPGQTVNFFKPCDDLQAIMIAKAELSIAGDIGPSDNTDILRDGGDFGCGDMITYTFSHPEAPTHLDISTDILK